MNSKPQIFGLHFSGGNVYSLQQLFAVLKHSYDIELPELPGRGKRLVEPLLYTRNEAVADLLRQIKGRRKQNVPYVIYGHSMGAELGYIIVKEMEKANDPPLRFIPTGNAGPNIHKRESLATLPRTGFFAELKEMGGIADEILKDEELMDFFEPILRADFTLLEKAGDMVTDFKINTPIFAIMGSDEKYAPDITNWQQYTLGHFGYKVVTGNHFFIYEHADTIIQAVRDGFADQMEPAIGNGQQ